MEFSGSGLRLSSDRPLRPDTLLKVDVADAMLLGEVIYCRHAGAKFTLGVKVDQVLAPLADLLRLQKALLDEQPARPPAVEPGLPEQQPVHAKTHQT